MTALPPVDRGLRGLLCAAVAACAPAMAQQPALRLSGSLTNLAVASRTFAGPRYTLDLSRVRLRAEGSIAAGLALDVQYDNEVLLGSYLRTAQFMQQKEAPVRPYWDAEANYHESRDAYGRHRLYRAWATLSVRNVDLRIGRQRIAWGTGRFWSPLDIVNPVEPLALEREERPGVDAVLVEAKLGPVSRLSAVYAPRRDGAAADRAAQWHGNVAGIDFSWMAGRLAGQAVLGMDVATQLGQAGLRAEATSQRLQGRASFRRLMLGLDYAFANTLTLSAEGFYNGAGVRDTASQDPAAPSAAPALGEATRYVGLYAGYEVTPLLKWTQHLVINADDGSRALDARLVWAARPDMELTLGVQGFAGRAGSEFARRPGTWLARLQWFF